MTKPPALREFWLYLDDKYEKVVSEEPMEYFENTIHVREVDPQQELKVARLVSAVREIIHKIQPTTTLDDLNAVLNLKLIAKDALAFWETHE
jgi:hypothetical protein